LIRCLQDQKLDDITSIYRDKQADIILGFDPIAVSQFVATFVNQYPVEEPLDTEKQDLFEQATHDENYHEYDLQENDVFDMMNGNHTDALEAIVEKIVTYMKSGQPCMDYGLTVAPTGDDSYRVTIGDVYIMDYEVLGNSYQVNYNPDISKIQKVVAETTVLLQAIHSYVNDSY
jgi:hypothetical protein